jgi:gamma-glutamyltranspeptidase
VEPVFRIPLRKNDYTCFQNLLVAESHFVAIPIFVIVAGMKRRLFTLALLVAVLTQGFVTVPAWRVAKVHKRDATIATHGMVASQHPIASQIGVDVLKKGGNAVDAAIAVGLALAVVYPEAGNIGGGGFMLIRKADGTFTSIDYREMAPAAASRNVFVDQSGTLIKGEGSSTVGYRASGVPGTIAGFEMAFKKYGSGKVKWADLVEPARAQAANGYVLTHRLANLFQDYKETLASIRKAIEFFFETVIITRPEMCCASQRWHARLDA